MTKNDTSLAVEKFGKCTDEYVPFVVREAIGEKYKKMEEAIKKVLDDSESKEGGWGPDHTMVSVLEEALYFDPLAFHE